MLLIRQCSAFHPSMICALHVTNWTDMYEKIKQFFARHWFPFVAFVCFSVVTFICIRSCQQRLERTFEKNKINITITKQK